MKSTGLMTMVLVTALSVGCHSGNNAARETASGTPGAAGTSGSGVTHGDVNFVRDVTDLNNAEIDLSRLAADQH